MHEGFETFQEADQRRLEKIAVLEGHGPQRCRLGRKLASCCKGQRCRSAACDVCLRAFRKSLSRKLKKIYGCSEHWTRASVITEKLTVPYGELWGVNLVTIVRRLRKRLERSPLRDLIVVMGIDVSLNLEDNEIQHWQFHLYLIVNADHTKELERAIKSTFPPEPTAFRPYEFEKVETAEKVLTYLSKAIFCRRSGYYRNNRHRTKYLPLKNRDQRQLSVFLDRHRLNDRLIFRGVRRNGRRLQLTPVGRRNLNSA